MLWYRIVAIATYFVVFLFLQQLGVSSISRMLIATGIAVFAGWITIILTRKKP